MKKDKMESKYYQDCPNCSNGMIGIAGRKDAICNNCGYKEPCC